MKVLDVDSMQSGIDLAIKDIEAFYGKISAVQRSVRYFYGLDDALKGKGGDAIRSFYNECHQPFLIFLYQSLVDYKNTLTEMKNGIESYESNTKGYVSEIYLENDVKSGLDKVETKTVELTASANAVLDSVKDLVPITKIDESEVVENVQRGKNKVNDVVEELHLLDEYETSQLKKTKEDLQTMRNYLSEIESKFQSGDLSIENYSVNAIKGIAAYKEMNDSIYNRKDENVEALNENSIKDMPMYAIEKDKNEKLDDLSETSKAIINNAYKDLESGEIDRATYYTILSTLELANGEVSEEDLEEDVPEGFVKYVIENSDKIGTDLGVNLTSATLEQIGLRTMEIGGLVNILTGKAGPTGPNSFVIRNEKTAKVSNAFINNGKSIRSVGKALGRGFMAAGVGIGMYEDLSHKNKTVGEAIAHNGAALGIGIGSNVIGSLGVKSIAALLGTNPGGWAIAGGIALGLGGTVVFNYIYDTNLWGTQDTLDMVGEQLSNFNDTINESVSNVVSNAGEAIKSGLNAINPMNWGW
nr:Bacillus transposase protein [Virgibacillus halodenitrificans]